MLAGFFEVALGVGFEVARDVAVPKLEEIGKESEPKGEPYFSERSSSRPAPTRHQAVLVLHEVEGGVAEKTPNPR